MAQGWQQYVLSVILLAFVLIFVLYIRTLQKALGKCSPESRTMAPGMVCFLAIPAVGLVWQFFVVCRISTSLRGEFTRRGMNYIENTPGRSLGLTMCALEAFALGEPILIGAPRHSLLGVLTSLINIASIPVAIAYWVRIHRYSEMLTAPGRPDTFGTAHGAKGSA